MPFADPGELGCERIGGGATHERSARRIGRSRVNLLRDLEVKRLPP
jgi:hypothetical protein